MNANLTVIVRFDIATDSIHVLVAFCHYIPVDEVPQGCGIVRAAVLIVEIVGVLPKVEGEQRDEAALHRIGCVGFKAYVQMALSVGREPNPS